jgi:hypothetical protein
MTAPWPAPACGRRLARLLVFGTALLAACASPHTANPDLANFQRCLQGDAWCDQQRLTEQQRMQIVEASAALHMQHCLEGRRCNRALLTAEEGAEVDAALAELNLQACLDGESGCGIDALTPAQREQAEANARRRNVERCLDDLPGCDPGALTDDERAAARARYLARNFAACQQSFASDCNLQDLDAVQAELVRVRQLEANLYLCTYALVGCVEDLLTSEQRATLRSR